MTTDTEAPRAAFEDYINPEGDVALHWQPAGYYAGVGLQGSWLDFQSGYWAGHAAAKAETAEQEQAMQRDAERLDWIIEHRAYVVSDPDCCDGYWLNYARPDGTMWTQATEHETPRAAIDAAKGKTP